MAKYWKILLTAILVAFATGWVFNLYLQGSESDSNLPNTQLTEKNPAKNRIKMTKRRTSLKDIIAAPLIPAPPAKTTFEDTHPCKGRWTHFAEQSIVDFENSYKDEPTDSKCTENEINLLPDSIRNLPGQQKLIYLRAAVINELTANENNLDILNSSVLMNQILIRFTRSEFQGDKGIELQKRIDALIEKEPSLYEPFKAKVALEIMRYSTDPSKENDAKVSKAVEDCKSFDVKDSEIEEASIIKFVISGRKDEAETYINKGLEINPNWPVGLYYKASFMWNQGEKEATLNLLSKAISLDPTNERFMNSKKAVNAAALKTQGLFISTLNFGFSDLN